MCVGFSISRWTFYSLVLAVRAMQFNNRSLLLLCPTIIPCQFRYLKDMVAFTFDYAVQSGTAVISHYIYIIIIIIIIFTLLLLLFHYISGLDITSAKLWIHVNHSHFLQSIIVLANIATLFDEIARSFCTALSFTLFDLAS